MQEHRDSETNYIPVIDVLRQQKHPDGGHHHGGRGNAGGNGDGRDHPQVENWAAMRETIRSNLGSPLLCVELSETQLNTAIQDAIDFTQEYWGQGSFKDVMPIQLIAGQREYQIENEGILAVLEILGASASAGDDYDDRRPFSLERMIARSIPVPGGANVPMTGRLGIADIETTMQYMRDWQFRYSTPYHCRWNDSSKTLTVEPTPAHDVNVGLLFYRREKIVNLFSRLQFRRLATAYAGKQWALNLTKYSMTLPGGTTMKADALLSTWDAEITKWEGQIRSEHASYFTVG